MTLDRQRDLTLVRAFVRARRAPSSAESRATELAMLERIRPVIERCATARWAEHRRRSGRASTTTVGDLVQSALAHVFADPEGTVGRYDPDAGALDGYVYAIARNAARDALRAETKHEARQVELPDALPAVDDAPERDPIAARHVRAVLDVFRDQASVLELEMFEALFVRDGEPADIAQERGWKSANTPNLWRFRIRKRLQAISEKLHRRRAAR